VKNWAGCALLACLLSACGPPRRPTAPAAIPPAPVSGSVPDLAAAIAADARRSDHESDSKIRAELAAQASATAAACLALEPQAASCLYGHALALGLEARAHPTRAGDLLTTMLGALTAAEAADASYDEAGPARVTALVLIRAPGWPLGPGDAEAGLVAARRAVTLGPQYPPNLLALGEALAKSGDANAAQESYRRARTLAQALPASEDRDDWLHQAEEALRRH